MEIKKENKVNKKWVALVIAIVIGTYFYFAGGLFPIVGGRILLIFILASFFVLRWFIKKYPDKLRSIWFWWILTTLVYTALNFSGYPGKSATPIGYIAGFIGLFVPYGVTSSVLFMFDYFFSWISLGAFLTCMVLIERQFNKWNFSLGKRIFLNLLALLVLTTMVDLIRKTPFGSWIIFFRGAFPDYF